MLEHSATLAKALDIQNNAEYLLQISHVGIQGRIPVFSPNEIRGPYSLKCPIEDRSTEEAMSVCLLKITSGKLEKDLRKFITNVILNLFSKVHPIDISEDQLQALVDEFLKT